MSEIDREDEVKSPILIKEFFDQNLKCNVKGTIELQGKVKGVLQVRINGKTKALTKFFDQTNNLHDVHDLKYSV